MSNFSTKIASTVSVVALVATAMSASLVSAASEFLPYAELLADNAVIGTQTNESGYRLGDTVTRAEMAKVTANLGGYTIASCAGTTYGDVGASLGDLCGAIEALADAGVVSTANANFRPSAPVTRAEATKMLLGAVGEAGSSTDAGYTDLANLGDLAMYVNRANELGCAADATFFRPNATASRGEAFKLAACVAGLTPTTVPPTGTGVVVPPTGTGVVAGALTVALDGAATAQYVPKNASSVKVGAIKLTAGSKDVTVQSLVVTRSGLGNSNDISSTNGIRASKNGVLVSSSADYYNPTSQKGTVYFSPALVVKAGTSTSVDVLVNLSGAENSQHQFTLTAVNAANATVTGVPVTLGLLNTTSYVTDTTTAILTASAGTVTPGKANQSIVKVDVSAGGRDTMVTGFTLTRSGATDFTKRLANAMVYRNGVAVGTITMTNEKLSVTGLSDTLLAGNTQTYEIKADILVDANSSTLGFKFDSTTDVSANEVSTGYATQVKTSPSTGVSIGFTSVEVIFTKLSTANATVAPGTNNIKLFNGKLTSAVPLTVRGITITAPLPATTTTTVTAGSGGIAASTTVAAGFTTTVSGAASGAVSTTTVTPLGIASFVNDQLSVKLNGAEIATLTSLSGLQVKTVSFVVDPTAPATITIEGSVKNVSAVQGAFTFTVSLSDVRDSSNNVAMIGGGANLTGDKTTIATAQVQIQSTTVSAPSLNRISSSSEQEIARFAVTTQNEAVRLQAVTFTGTVSGGGLPNLQTIASSTSSLKLVDVATNLTVSSTANITGNVITFTNMNDVVLKDATKNYAVVMNISSVENYYGATLNLGTPTIVAVRDTNSTTIMATGTANVKTYNIGVTSPSVVITAISPLASNNSIAKIVVTNNDSNTGMTLSGVNLGVGYRYTTNGNALTFAGQICLSDSLALDNGAVCGGSGTSAPVAFTQAGITSAFSLAGTNAGTIVLAKNGGSVTFYVYNNTTAPWFTGDIIATTVNSITYVVGTPITETLSNLSATSAK